MKRNETRKILINDLEIGGNDHIIIQSMTNTPTKDVNRTIQQILDLEEIGCELVRVAVLDEEDLNSLAKIKEKIHIPLVADIHFDSSLAIGAINQGCDAIRINPGNFPLKDLKNLIKVAKEHHTPIRIGVNSGSIQQEYESLERKEGLLKSIQSYIELFKEQNFEDIILSAKSSDINDTIWINEKLSELYDYPIHIGLTEAGDLISSTIRSTIALGKLLQEGIGNTIRISINGDPKDEIISTKELLKALNLATNVPFLIACPTCGRCLINTQEIVKKMRSYLGTVNKNITVAIMGCVVNGPGEAKHADIGIAGGKDCAMIFKKGKILRTVYGDENKITNELIKEINNMVK